jgi:nucleotidyltransferase AbiEii toxin of type IV toxin-antitoxin system
VSAPGSHVRIQIQLDPRYDPFTARASERDDVLGERLPVADIADVMAGKVWAASNADRRGSKRQKDLADIARLLEVEPALRARVPKDILDRLL